MINNIIQLVDNMAALSTCERRKVGAILTDDKFNAIGCGFNCVISKGCCKRHEYRSGERLELCNAIHAEMVAVSNRDIAGKKLFVNLFPCPICAKYLANCKLGELYYNEDYEDMADSAELLMRGGVKIFKYNRDGSIQEVKVVAKNKAPQEVKKQKFFGE